MLLFGAGLFAAPMVHALRQNGVAPSCILDNAERKQGQNIEGIAVLSPTEGYRRFPRATVVISTAPKYIEEVRTSVKAMGWETVVDGAPWLASFSYDCHTFPKGLGNLHYELDRYMAEYFAKYHPDLLLIPSIDVIVTEKCSLRCRDCANLMQYYARPQHMDVDEVFRSLDELMQYIDHVLEFRILGGEALVNPAAWQFVEKLFRYSKFTRIAVYANGTVVPKNENVQILKHENVYLRVTDYGDLSRRLAELKDLLDLHAVEYDIQPAEEWQECSGLSFRGRTTVELEHVHACCCASRTFTLMHSHLYPCPFAANATNLDAIPRFPEDRLTLDGTLTRDEARAWLFDAVRTRAYLSACNYCGGRDLSGPSIPPGRQAAAPLPYERADKGGS